MAGRPLLTPHKGGGGGRPFKAQIMKTKTKQFEIVHTPCGNYAITSPRGYLAARHGDYWRENQSTPAFPAVYLSEIICRETLADYSRFLMDLAKRRESEASAAREHFAKLFGDSGFPNRFPVSGGVCLHWPSKVRDRVRELVRLASDAREESLAAWLAAGKQSRTWRGV